MGFKVKDVDATIAALGKACGLTLTRVNMAAFEVEQPKPAKRFRAEPLPEVVPIDGDGCPAGWIELPIAPTTNNLFLNLRNGGRTLSPKYRAWKKKAAAALRGIEAIENYPVRVRIAIRNGKGWRSNSDVANREKATIDAMVECGVLAGDSSPYVQNVTIEFWNCKRRDRPAAFFIKIEPMEPIWVE